MPKAGESRRVEARKARELVDIARDQGFAVKERQGRLGGRAYIHNAANNMGTFIALEPGPGRSLADARQQLRRIGVNFDEDAMVKVADSATISESLRKILPIQNAQSMTVPQRAHALWEAAITYAQGEQAQIEKAQVDGTGRFDYPANEGDDYYVFAYPLGLGGIWGTLFPTLRGWKQGRDETYDYLTMTTNAVNVTHHDGGDRNTSTWLLRATWKTEDGAVTNPPQSVSLTDPFGIGPSEVPEPRPLPAPAPMPQAEVAPQVIHVPINFATGDDEMDAALTMMAEAVRTRLGAVQPDLAQMGLKIATLNDQVASLEERVQTAEEWRERIIEAYIESPMSALAVIAEDIGDAPEDDDESSPG